VLGWTDGHGLSLVFVEFIPAKMAFKVSKLELSIAHFYEKKKVLINISLILVE
jgi:hypothetical protein